MWAQSDTHGDMWFELKLFEIFLGLDTVKMEVSALVSSAHLSIKILAAAGLDRARANRFDLKTVKSCFKQFQNAEISLAVPLLCVL